MKDWKKIEALLFASGKYLTEEQLIALSKIPKNKIKKALKDLKKKYEEADTSLTIFNEGDAWKLNVKEEFTDVIREVVSDAEMPRAVMETLAIIAYKSPVLQSEIKDIRGTTVYDHIPLLETKGFITREKHGRSYKIRLTTKFHEYFDIEGDSELAELFKDIKKPEPKKLGELEVYEEDNNDSEFTEKIVERMKKLEKTDKENKDENNFLNEFDKKYEETKQKIDESENEINSFRKKTDDDTKEIFGEEKPEEETEGNEDDTKTDDDTTDEEKDQPEFLKKVNKQIDELTKGRDSIDLKEAEKENEEDTEEETESEEQSSEDEDTNEEEQKDKDEKEPEEQTEKETDEDEKEKN